MPASQQLKVLSVRLPETEVRRLKSLAAIRGVSVQTAVHQAIEAWTSTTEGQSAVLPLGELEGSLGNVDVLRMLREERKAEQRKDRRRLHEGS